MVQAKWLHAGINYSYEKRWLTIHLNDDLRTKKSHPVEIDITKCRRNKYAWFFHAAIGI